MPFWIQLAASKHPDRIAIEGLERNLTYTELARAANSAAGAVQGLELEPGSPAALALPPGEEFVIAMHACLLSGHPVVPLGLRLSEAERAQRLAGAGVVISEPLLGSGSSGIRNVSSRDSLVAVMHTSGTTAAPKPVQLSFGNFLASALGSAVALGLDPGERWLCPMPLTHVGGLSIPIRSAIYATTAVLHGRFDAERVLNDLMDAARRITMVSLVPTMLSRLLDAGLSHPPTLRWALLGGAPIAPALLERAAAAGVPVAPSYGMTEACSQIATNGWPLPGIELSLGPDAEILVRGDAVSEGALAPDGWLHTADLGSFDEIGRLAITGRKSDTIVTGGENVAPTEVEAVLLQHPAVADAGVFARPDAEWGERIVAAVVRRDGIQVSAEELRAYCAANLASFKVPKEVEFAQSLPRSASGKLLRRELATGR
jgi:O-succinylbenzoic acid--CoA ligase